MGVHHQNLSLHPTVLRCQSEVLEKELIEAAFGVCFPNYHCMPVTVSAARTPEIESPDPTQNGLGGCILSICDSDLADAWINKNYDQRLLVLIRQSQIGGPFPSMLSFNKAALTIFGTMSVFFMRIAQELADLSGFPVIVRPLEEDPSRFTSSRTASAANNAGGQGNTMHGGMKQAASSAQSTSQGGRTYNLANSSETTRKQQPDSDDEEEPAPPPSPPIQGVSPKEIVHSTDVTLKLSNNPQNKGRFLRVITKVKLYPPNVKEVDHARAEMAASDPSIEGHVDLHIQSGGPIKVDNILGSVGFLSQGTGHSHLRTEYFVPRGYSMPKKKLKRVMGNQRSATVGATLGVAGGKPVASINTTVGRAASLTKEFADDEVHKQWLVSRQQMLCNQDSEAFSFRGLNTMIREYHVPMSTNPCDGSDVQAKYGIAVEVANTINKATPTPQISFIYRHQIHCWVEGASKSGVRGLIVLASHFIPDILIERSLWIEGHPILDLEESNSSKETSKVSGPGPGNLDHFVFAAGTPKVKKSTGIRKLIQRLFKGLRTGEQGTPVSTLISRGSQPTPLGWDNTSKEWYYPIWPELDCDLGLSLDKSTTRWRMEWGDEAN